jgi:hypothetical protein
MHEEQTVKVASMAMVSRRSLRIALSTGLLGVAACHAAIAQTAQEHVHHIGHTVMPFDLAGSVHIFKMTDTGGIQRVIVRDPNSARSDQIALIRQHLAHEAKEFQAGNFSDPAALHGAGMPGMEDLTAGSERIKVTYEEVPLGAQITFQTSDIHLLTAIHRWFGAQLSEHGADAKTE